MKRWVMGLAALGLAVAAVGHPGCGRSVDLEVVRQFQQAQAAFDRAASAEDFRRVAAMYQALLDSGVVCGAVLYNQGNAWMKANEPGRAIAAYRQAARYRPSDPYLAANLDYALRIAGAPAVAKPLVQHLLFWQDWISYPGKWRLTAGVAAGALGLGLAGLVLQRRWLGRAAVGAVVLASILAFSAGYDWFRFDHQEHGVVVADEVIARKGNSTSYEPAFTAPLTDGTEFEVVQRRGDWLEIRPAADQEGCWIPADAAVVY